jgi:filamentous hemagglutinin
VGVPAMVVSAGVVTGGIGNMAAGVHGLSAALMMKGGGDSNQSEPSTPVNLSDPSRSTHILQGDRTGGGHLYPGNPGKSAFPQNWSAEKIMHEISDVATDPASTVIPGRGGRIIVTGTRGGIDITVVIESKAKGGGIVTGFPTNVPRNP